MEAVAQPRGFMWMEQEREIEFYLGYPNEGKRVSLKLYSDAWLASRCKTEEGKMVEFARLKERGIDDDIDTDDDQVEDEFSRVFAGLKAEGKRRFNLKDDLD